MKQKDNDNGWQGGDTVEYYLKAFHSIEQNKIVTWNWSAFMLGPFWFLIRKMYFYFLVNLFLLFFWFCYDKNTVIYNIASYLGVSTTINIYFFSGYDSVFFIIYQMLCGMFGNYLYYRIIKQRILKGYHEIEGYGSIVSDTVIAFVFLSVIGIVWDYYSENSREHPEGKFVLLFFWGVFCVVYAVGDFFMHYRHFEHDTPKDTKVSDQNITLYLLASNPDDNDEEGKSKSSILNIIQYYSASNLTNNNAEGSKLSFPNPHPKDRSSSTQKYRTLSMWCISIIIFGLFSYKTRKEPLNSAHFNELSIQNIITNSHEQDIEEYNIKVAACTILFMREYEKLLSGTAKNNVIYQAKLERINSLYSEFKQNLKLLGRHHSTERRHAKSAKMVFLERLTYLIHLLSIEHHKAEIKSIISAYDSTISEREIDTIINKVPLINEEHWHKICIFIEHEKWCNDFINKYREKAEANEIYFQYVLGELYVYILTGIMRLLEQKYDINEGIKWLQLASDQNNKKYSGRAASFLVDFYGYVEQNYIKARKWCVRAFEQGVYQRIIWLAFDYRYGRGTEKNMYNYFELIKKAAYGYNLPYAQYCLGCDYLEGIICNQNIKEAKTLLKLAARNGNNDAKYMIENETIFNEVKE